MGIYSTLNIGRDALLTQQRAIEVAGHNIANVNTPGYSRQKLILTAKNPIPTWAGELGTGVQGIEVERIADKYLGDQINSSAQDLGRWEAQRDSLERIEIVFDEATGYGLNSAMSEFWNAWQDLANNPSGNVQRNLLVGMSENLANTFNNIYSDLAGLQNDIDFAISGTVTEINRLATQIADLNDKIESIEAAQQNPNDYRDERDQLLKELSGLIDFTSSEASDGVVTVTLGDSTDLVSSSGASSLVANDTDADGFLDIAWSSAPATAINSNISGGKLKGWLETRDVIVPDYLTRLETLATTLRDQVNAEHIVGYGLDGTQNNFFDPIGTPEAGTFAVNTAIISDINKIAAGDSSNYGDNQTALRIAGLQNDLTISANTATFDDYYNSIVSDVGIKVDEAGVNYKYQYSTSAQLENYRQSVSGVSLDEEMVNLIKFQHAYNAAAKLITMVDELMDALMRII
ncbi:MAG: flagellar hook-associated protein FlgK [Deltaproteobacteria bacterium]|nr:flagellar hook-associated protein FlgK [Deltaproteobacteria bacterium]